MSQELDDTKEQEFDTILTAYMHDNNSEPNPTQLRKYVFLFNFVANFVYIYFYIK